MIWAKGIGHNLQGPAQMNHLEPRGSQLGKYNIIPSYFRQKKVVFFKFSHPNHHYNIHKPQLSPNPTTPPLNQTFLASGIPKHYT